MQPTSNNTLFEYKNTINDIRTGVLRTRVGKVLTPTFMPDGTRGAVKSLTPEMVNLTGVQVVLANTYHLHLQPGEDVIASLGGLRKFANREGPILTDSGGFQVFSLAHANKITEEGVTFKDPKSGDTIFLSPEKSIQIQMKLGADMMVVLDDVTALDAKGKDRTLEAFERTHRWLDRNIAEFKRLTAGMADPGNLSQGYKNTEQVGAVNVRERPLLFGVVQGGLDKNLRKKSLELIQASEVDGIAIGGLSVGESRAEMHDMLDFLASLYDNSPRPRFLLGVGDPTDVRYGIERGIDMFDCVLPTRNARHATVWQKGCVCSPNTSKASLRATSEASSDISSFRGSVTVPDVQFPGTSQKKFKISSQQNSSAKCKHCGQIFDKKIHLTNAKFATDKSPIDEGCDCYTCVQGFSKGFLRHQFKVGEPLAGTLASIHNIRYLERICQSYRS